MSHSIVKKITFCILLLMFTPVWAQYDPPGEEDPAAPINTYVVWLAVLGLFFAFLFLRNREYKRLS